MVFHHLVAVMHAATLRLTFRDSVGSWKKARESASNALEVNNSNVKARVRKVKASLELECGDAMLQDTSEDLRVRPQLPCCGVTLTCVAAPKS